MKKAHKMNQLNEQINYFEITSSFHVDFNKLAINDRNELWKQIIVLDGKTTIDFFNQKSLIKLTSAIMKQIFNLEWFINENNLCPRVPNRINYLIWLHKHVESLLLKNQPKSANSKSRRCLDIGTGSSLIYPLLGYRMFGWSFLASQISNQSIQNCHRLIQANKLTEHIKLIKAKQQYFFKDCIEFEQQIDMVLCNPPFFDSQQESLEPLSRMEKNQHAAMGGEYDFFFRIYVQSFNFLNIQYFTMMIGLGRDFYYIKQFLQDEFKHYNVLEMIRFGQINQGSNSRFIICWKIKRQ